MFAAHQFRQVSCLLFGSTIALKLIDAKIGMRAIRQRNRCRGPADFFHRDHMLKITKPGAAVLFGNGHAQQAKITELAPQIVGEFVLLINLGRARCDFGLGKG